MLEFQKFKQSLKPDDYIVIESSTNAFWFYDEVKDLIKECFVINTRKFKDISNSFKKTDNLDAKKLAKHLKYLKEK